MRVRAEQHPVVGIRDQDDDGRVCAREHLRAVDRADDAPSRPAARPARHRSAGSAACDRLPVGDGHGLGEEADLGVGEDRGGGRGDRPSARRRRRGPPRSASVDRYRDDRRRRRNAEGASEVDQRRVGRQPGARERRETDESERRIPASAPSTSTRPSCTARTRVARSARRSSSSPGRLRASPSRSSDDPRERHVEGGQHHRRPSLLAVAPSPHVKAWRSARAAGDDVP